LIYDLRFTIFTVRLTYKGLNTGPAYLYFSRRLPAFRAKEKAISNAELCAHDRGY